MRVLLTGASGLIGHRLVLKLLHDGHDLVLLGRNVQKLKKQFPLPCEAVSWNPEQARLPQEATDGIDAVIHLAGEPIAGKRWTPEQKREIRNSRVHGTRNLVDALIQSGGANPQVFISASGIGYYGDRGDEILDEKSAAGKDFLAEVCQKWESEARRACEISPHTRCIVLRTAMVLAREGGALSKLAPVFQAGLGGPLGSGSQWMSWIHIDDLVSLIAEALVNAKLHGVVNATSPHPVTNREFSKTLAKALHRPALLPTPARAIQAVFGELSQALLGSQRALPKAAEEAGFKFQYPELAGAFGEIFPDWYINGTREFVAHQWVSKPAAEIFPFFAAAENLERITPPWLGFHVVNQSTPKIEAGTVIDYELKLHGLPIKWKTRIEEWIPGERFVDLQMKGPYRLWRHTHLFTPIKGGTLMTDRVLYKVPFGTLGALAAGSYVKNDVGKIFDYRRKVVEKIFAERRSP